MVQTRVCWWPLRLLLNYDWRHKLITTEQKKADVTILLLGLNVAVCWSNERLWSEEEHDQWRKVGEEG